LVLARFLDEGGNELSVLSLPLVQLALFVRVHLIVFAMMGPVLLVWRNTNLLVR
jgi:hypothetical protein